MIKFTADDTPPAKKPAAAAKTEAPKPTPEKAKAPKKPAPAGQDAAKA